jgi:hypothetical protein
MKRFLTIFEGDSPSQAVPVVATEDRVVIRAAIDALQKRLREPEESPVRPIRSQLSRT